MSHSWLQRKRKGELIELAQRANLPDADNLLKDDLVEALFGHLEANETTFAKQADFSDFYGRNSSPVKRERVSPSEAISVPKTRRRQTLVKASESEEPAATPEKTTALVTRTPRTVTRIPSRVTQVDLPASPAQVAELADQSFQAARTKATEIWEKTKIDEFKEWLRENASSVSAIQTLILTIEAVALQYNTLSNEFAFTAPAVGSLKPSTTSVYFPNAWLLLTSGWWAPATLWSLTSWALPLVFSYFFNLTLRSNTNHKSSSRQLTIDPVTFNIVRALLFYTAYKFPVVDPAMLGQPGTVTTNDLNWGPFASETVAKVRDNVPGGYYGLQIGALVGVIYSIYDAALKK
ncbi:hypothetical protein BS50DRAFT_268063 [Corynespora cassiicola Philippines]|uniref:Uncharacterized protein n=1 Tax=Corynespora cassiicola Philippines TaxID=1448308 RepID=A0A2T2P0B8_CORCC|nr:hypothetical protein BS50DRAFT_268063 [Corynespora cassiicola Philippines]